jgi:curli production assembly/transport component CsgF
VHSYRRTVRALTAVWLGAVALMAPLGDSAVAQDIVYQPVNPSFGGNPFNSNHLLGVANAQNDFTNPATSNSNSQADIFARQLQSRLLSALSSQIVTAIFGDNPQESGTISFGGQTVRFIRSLTEVTITIINDDTGEETVIVVPTFVDVD